MDLLRILAACAVIAAFASADPVKLIIDTDFGGGGCQVTVVFTLFFCRPLKKHDC